MAFYRYFLFCMGMVFLIPEIHLGQGTQSRRMTTVYENAAREHDSILAMKVPELEVDGKYPSQQLPFVMDNSQNEYWPGIHDQYMFYSCQQYAGVEYVFAYEINRLRNQPGYPWEASYPAHYTWNFMNQGERFVGVSFLQSFDVIKQQGHMTSSDYGADTATSVTGWINGYDKYYHGMSNHLKQVYAIKVNSTAGINTLRNYLYDHLDGSPSGGIACFTTSSGTFYYMHTIPPGTPEAGKNIILEWLSDPVHGLTVVGYNDSIRFDVNLDGQYTNDLDITGDGFVDARDWEIGAFKIANSYGGWWSDNGFAYALYRTFALNYDEGGIWNNRVYVVEADTAYRPLLTLKVNLDYNARSRIRILAGVSNDTLAQLPGHVIDFPIFNFQGGDHSMQGYDSVPEARSIELGLDVTALLNYIPSGQAARYFLMVEERDPDHIGQGKISNASFISYSGTPAEIQVNETDVDITDNNTTMVSTVAAFDKPDVRIVTTHLPPYDPAQPVQVQLEASGGRTPYEWSFVEEYVTKPSGTPEPLITGTSIQVHHETESFARVALPFSFPFFGKKFDSIYVNYYGFICFEPQNLPTPYTTDETGMLRMFPLIVPSFSQQYVYQFNKNDGIWFQGDASHAIIRWKVSVSPYVTSSTDDFAVILYPDGRFEFCYGVMDNQGFTHKFYKGISKGDELNYDIQTQWNGNEIAGKSLLYDPPEIPEGLSLDKSGLLSVETADSTIIYSLKFRVTDAMKISDSKVLMFSSGLEIVHELVCGEDDRLKSAQQASLKLTLTNNLAQPLQNLVLRIRSYDSLLLITDSLFTVPLINPGQTLSIPSAFAFILTHALEDGFPVMMTLEAQSATGSWKKELLFPVAAPEMSVEPPFVEDGYNNRLDPGEVADLSVSVKNTGSLEAQNLQLKLVCADPGITILSAPLIPIALSPVFSTKEFRFQLRVDRDVTPGSMVAMQVFLNDSSGVLQVIDFSLTVGSIPVAVLNLSASKASMLAMVRALDSLQVSFDTINELPVDHNRYASLFLILGTAISGSHPLTDSEGSSLAAYLYNGGNLYLESYYFWYYNAKTSVHPLLKYTSKKIPAYYYPDVTGISGTFTDSMSYIYTAPMSYAVFNIEPVSPAYSTMINTASPSKNLEIVYDGTDYKTIGTMLDFSALYAGSPPSTQTTLMQRYLEFFDLNLTGPYPLFHTTTTTVCQGQSVMFTDDSFDNITSRSWEFEGGEPATSTDSTPEVRYNTTGKYDVKLTVSDGVHSQTILKQQYIQVGQCSGTGENAAAGALFRIFPNPATSLVTIEVTQGIRGYCKLTLFDLTGSRIREFQQIIPAGNRVGMDLSGMEKGIYFLRVQIGEKNSTLKVIRN